MSRSFVARSSIGETVLCCPVFLTSEIDKMPLYEYECKTCDQTVEVLVRNGDEEPECPGCGDHDLEKVFSVPAAPAMKSAGGGLPVTAQDCSAPGGCCGGGCQL